MEERPDWLKRALNPDTPMTEARETVRTESSDGKLYPTIRMIDGKLVKLSSREAYNMAIDKGDFIQFNSDEEANEFSNTLSKLIDDKRQSILSKGGD